MRNLALAGAPASESSSNARADSSNQVAACELSGPRFSAHAQHPQVLPAPFPDFLTAVEVLGCAPPREDCIFAISECSRAEVGERGNRDGDGALASVLALLKTSRTHKSTEIVFGPVLPVSLRTHAVCTAITVGLLGYALQLPAMGLPGLCMRCVRWQVHPVAQARTVHGVQR
ncbi:hypothetical protein FOMPIDRAFT_1049485 [Fomitopsis schrenkii]|uniref:Uncharacterized protein n=1 Tax=Fomitopsis schrenkii TaxID=2126942 RepID=S8E6U7_FOMSC|nr:hypothetical protein FOMPIDRAFT_1049485 [Fomitopsis schrenkii]